MKEFFRTGVYWTCRFLPAAVFVAAGISKVVNPLSMRESFDWLGIDQQSQLALARLLGSYEVFLGGWLFTGLSYRSSRLLTTFTLVFFVGILAVMRFSAHPPSCGCFALVRLFHSNKTELLQGIGRNLILLALLWVIETPRSNVVSLNPQTPSVGP